MWSGFSTLSFPQARLEFVKETKLRQMGKQLVIHSSFKQTCNWDMKGKFYNQSLKIRHGLWWYLLSDDLRVVLFKSFIMIADFGIYTIQIGWN